MLESLVIVLAFAFGLGFRKCGYPPLLGYLIAGFVAYPLGLGDRELIDAIADIGITLLLFTIGLKLNLRELKAPQVWAVAGLHMMIAIPLTTLVIIASGFLIPSLALETESAWILAFALSFSSTVFAVKVFDERGESASLHALIAIGILIVQDLVAVIYLVLSSDKPPSIYALALLGLPLIRPALLYLLRLVGHGELLVLLGISVALASAELFELVHLKGGLGALIFGVLLGNSPKSNELYKSLIHFKDLFLIGFFLQIGYGGLPSANMMLIVFALGVLICLRPLIYFFLFVLFKLRARTALLAGASLFNYSEFGLIVAAIAASNGLLPDYWVATIALAMSLSFFIAIPFNTRINAIFVRLSDWLHKVERPERLPEEPNITLGDADILILGLGRVGSGAYDYLNNLYPARVVGVEESYEKSEKAIAAGVNCVRGDASDRDFWGQAELAKRRLILVSLTNHNENVEVVKQLHRLNFDGQIAVVSRFSDEQNQLQDMGCITFNLYAEAGHGFAEHVVSETVGLKSTLLPSTQGDG